MADETDRPTPVGPSFPPIAEIASAHAPFLCFEAISAFGHANGIVQVTLEALRMYSNAPNEPVRSDRVIVANLRMSIAAALSLKATIDGAILMATPVESEAKN